MTTPTVHGGSTFQTWQLRHARLHGHHERHQRLVRRWLQITVALMFRTVRRIMQPVLEVVAAIGRAFVAAVQPIVANLQRAGVL